MTNDDKTRFTFRLPQPLFATLEGIATKKGVSINALLLKILWVWRDGLKRQDLLDIFSDEELTELEVEIYAAKKRRELALTESEG